MHPLIEKAKQTIATWTNDEPHNLATAVATLCRDTLDAVARRGTGLGVGRKQAQARVHPAADEPATVAGKEGGACMPFQADGHARGDACRGDR